ncbi:DUF4241 domain-containing protein [Chitinimonas viridis]|uniref:DUF4241 domain-containing protein n=1 Tax=Chitinimonas viridis TaxID=664880 RepID=A0ABT8B123_9NEIS|nr:DUF4241 domain-containing protein [Chitinimonas viridis]MDN3575189.1 DUF4241 domain-containing protein [Chitinimonas viridis]
MSYLHPIYPDRWMALAEGDFAWTVDDKPIRYRLHTVPCGELWLKQGRLVPCDPFVTLQWQGNPELQLPPGCYPVVATVADISEAQDGSHLRECYLSLLLSAQPAVGWRFLTPVAPGVTAPLLGGHEFVGVPVDSGKVGFVDADAVARLMPDPDEMDWQDELFDNGQADAWFARMDEPSHLQAGLANIILPGATDGENLILAHSGWGDGTYAVVGSYDASGALTGVHIDLAVLPLAPLPEWD